MTIKYDGSTVLPSEIRAVFEDAKTWLCELSREADKTSLIIDRLRSDLVFWLSEHQA